MSDDERFLVPVVDSVLDLDADTATVSFLTVPAPTGLDNAAAGARLLPLFTTDEAALLMAMDPERCVRPRLSALIELLGEQQLAVLDAGADPTLVLSLGALAGARPDE